MRIFRTQLAIKRLFKFPPHLTSAFFRYLEKEKQAKYALKWTKKLQRILPLRICGPKQRVDCKVWLSCSSESTRWRLGMLMNSRSDWLSLNFPGAAHYRQKNYQNLIILFPATIETVGNVFRTQCSLMCPRNEEKPVGGSYTVFQFQFTVSCRTPSLRFVLDLLYNMML